MARFPLKRMAVLLLGGALGLVSAASVAAAPYVAEQATPIWRQPVALDPLVAYYDFSESARVAGLEIPRGFVLHASALVTRDGDGATWLMFDAADNPELALPPLRFGVPAATFHRQAGAPAAASFGAAADE